MFIVALLFLCILLLDSTWQDDRHAL